jgi:tRNA pseudouridine38-40 synthase
VRNLLLKLAFVGTEYVGWQRQKNGLAIQEVLERAIAEVTGEPARVTGCCRTDAGVHAEQYFANFKTDSSIPTSRFHFAIQSHLPDDILVSSARLVSDDFNARRDALEKNYRYQILRGHSPFLNHRWWQCSWNIDYSVLPALAELIVGDHEFSGFCVRRSRKQFNRCLIKKATWRKQGRKLYFKIIGNRFLHHMVRFLVGAQMEVAAGRMERELFEKILRQPEKQRALYPAPADGLYLEKVRYPQRR